MIFCTVKLKTLLLSFFLSAFFFFLCFSAPLPAFKSGTKEIPIYSVKRDDNKISLTFNCAWGDEDIDDILSVLKKYNADATFFVVGTWAEKYPESLLKIHSSGFEIGNHSYNHAHYSKLSKENIIKDIEKGDNAIKTVTNTAPLFFRAAYGEYTNDVIYACNETGRCYIQWSVDSLDYKANSPDEISKRVLEKTKSGDIILMHTGTKYTKDSLEEILSNLTKNFSLVRVSDLVYQDNFKIDVTGKQYKE